MGGGVVSFIQKNDARSCNFWVIEVLFGWRHLKLHPHSKHGALRGSHKAYELRHKLGLLARVADIGTVAGREEECDPQLGGDLHRAQQLQLDWEPVEARVSDLRRIERGG